VRRIDMLRTYSSETKGWSALRYDENTKKMSSLISANIDKLPAEVYVQSGACSVVQVRTADAMVVFTFHAKYANRFQEHCSVKELEYKCWRCRRRIVIWECKEAGHRAYYVQRVSNRRFKHESLLEIFEISTLQRCEKNVARAMLLTGKKMPGLVAVSEVVVVLHQDSIRVEFKHKKQVPVKTRHSGFTLPRAVNICYTGCIHGDMRRLGHTNIPTKKGSKGPCGSEMHIDTSMGVLQIFSNNNGYRKITCKAFQNKKEAEFVVDYVCNAVCGE